MLFFFISLNDFDVKFPFYKHGVLLIQISFQPFNNNRCKPFKSVFFFAIKKQNKIHFCKTKSKTEYTHQELKRVLIYCQIKTKENNTINKKIDSPGSVARGEVYGSRSARVVRSSRYAVAQRLYKRFIN